MLALVEQEDGTASHDGTEQGVCLAGVELSRCALEELLDQGGVEDHDEAVIEQGAHVDGAAVAPPARVEEAWRREDEGDRLQQARPCGSGGERARRRGGVGSDALFVNRCHVAWAERPWEAAACGSRSARGSG